jgi:hypothetical protein
MRGIELAQECADRIIDLFAAGANIAADRPLSFIQGLPDAGCTCAGAAS